MFIARQPIFNRSLNVFGYELLYRSGEKSTQFDGISSMGATAGVLGGLFESGIDHLVEDKLALINFDEEFINSDSIELVSPDRLIIEMLEDVKINDLLIARLGELKNKGYMIALDDFYGDYTTYPLVPLADIIKFDIIATPLSEIGEDVNAALAQNKIILAEKIETKEEFVQAKDMGFHLFQGFFFSRPSIAMQSTHKATPKAQYSRLLSELKEDEPSFQTLAEIIETDVHMAYRLMRIASRRAEEEVLYSIKRALIYMGLREFERWINILMLQDFGRGKPPELTRISLIRSRMAESITLQVGLQKNSREAALMGLFSVLDAMFDTTMNEALEDISLPESIVDALVYKRGDLYPIYNLLLSYEKGEFMMVQYWTKELNLDVSKLYQDYLGAIEWTAEIFDLIN